MHERCLPTRIRIRGSLFDLGAVVLIAMRLGLAPLLTADFFIALTHMRCAPHRRCKATINIERMAP
jgi:hypothetical protein